MLEDGGAFVQEGVHAFVRSLMSMSNLNAFTSKTLRNAEVTISSVTSFS